MPPPNAPCCVPGQETAGGRARSGQARWEAVVAEYVEPGDEDAYELAPAAQHLLTTSVPEEAGQLLTASETLLSTGK